MRRELAAEALGTAMLVAAVVGSGIMGEALAGGDDAVALLANTVATGAALYVVITILGPVSGAHINPVVTMVFTLSGRLRPGRAAGYMLAQTAGGVAGAWLAHYMFELPVLQLSENARSGLPQYVSEVVASFGLLLAILLGIRFRPGAVPALVGFYIASAYWFTASTSFANPAVTVARTLSDTFSGIHYGDTLPFIAAQIIGALLAMGLSGLLADSKNA